jgi:hypothetical protein
VGDGVIVGPPFVYSFKRTWNRLWFDLEESGGLDFWRRVLDGSFAVLSSGVLGRWCCSCLHVRIWDVIFQALDQADLHKIRVIGEL